MVKKHHIIVIIEFSISLLLFVFSLLFFLVFKDIFYVGIICIVLAVILLFVAIMTKLPKVEIPRLELYLDVKGQSRNVSRGEEWFLKNLEPKHISRIQNHFDIINSYIRITIKKSENKQDYDYFVNKIKLQLNNVFKFMVVRSYTKYKQQNYVKTSYIDFNVEWSRSYSSVMVKDMMASLFNKECKIIIPEYSDKKGK